MLSPTSCLWRRVSGNARPRLVRMLGHLTQVMRLLSIETRNNAVSSKLKEPGLASWTLHPERQNARHVSFPPIMVGFAAGFSVLEGAMGADIFINAWLLNILRSPISEVYQHKSTLDKQTLNISQEGLRDLVLEW
jgi:hypothetical protein